MPDYGQMACLSALAALTTAGHLRRVRERAESPGTRWVTRTYFSRTARDDDWWTAFRRARPHPRFSRTGKAVVGVGGVGKSAGGATSSARHPAQTGVETTGGTFRGVRRAGRTRPRRRPYGAVGGRMRSVGEPGGPVAGVGATRAQVLGALTAGLPERVHSPGALVRKRLIAKMPPEPARPRACGPGARPSPSARNAAYRADPRRCPAACAAPAAASRAPPCGPGPAAVRRHVIHLRATARTTERNR
ncbi:hypothetical protein NKH77_22995 [Streptomyces sp. M19]